MIKKIALLLALVFSVSCLFVCTAVPADASLESQLEQAEKDLQAAKDKAKELQKKLDEVYKDREASLEAKILMQQQVSNLEVQIEAMNKVIEQLDIELLEKNSSLVALRQQYDAAYEIYRQRVRTHYESRKLSLIEVLLTSESLAEMMTKIDLISQLAEFDQTILERLRSTLREQTALAGSIEAELNRQKELRDQISGLKTEQETKLNAIEAMLLELQKNEQKYKDQLAQNEKDIEDYDKKIDQLVSAIEAYKGGELLWPVPGYSRISSGWGWREFDQSFHKAIDIPAPKGTTIIAAAAGTVLSAAEQKDGNMQIVIDHGSGLTTRYNHLSKFSVKKGDKVEKGQKIGEVGSTGYSTGNHLDFRIRYNGEYYNPELYVNPKNNIPEKSIQDLLAGKG